MPTPTSAGTTAPAASATVTNSATPSAQPAVLDLAIIGSGPAALSAALYAARAGLRVSVFERANIGGALCEIAQISNYPGFTGPGRDLAAAMRRQAESAGATITYGECTAIRLLESSANSATPASDGASAHTAARFELTIDGEPVRARTVLLATGSEPRPLPFALSTPVSYCALCDADLAKGQGIAVVGGGNSAVQESLGLAPLVKSLTLITHSALKAEPHLIAQLRALPNVTIREHLEPTPDLLNTFARVFVFIGKRPATTCLADLAASTPDFYDAAGYVCTVSAPVDSSLAPASAAPSILSHQTAIPGLYVAGDLRSGALRQVVTAAGDGAAAAVEISQSLRSA